MENLSKAVPVGDLAIIGTRGTEKMLSAIEEYIGEWRGEEKRYKVNVLLPRFGTGEAKGLLTESLRGKDVFIIADCYNYGVEYQMYGMRVPMSPDEHYQDVKRIISAIGGKSGTDFGDYADALREPPASQRGTGIAGLRRDAAGPDQYGRSEYYDL